MAFTAPEAWRDGELLLRCYQPGDGAELNRATQSSLEHLRPWMEWASPDTTVEDSEEPLREKAPARAPKTTTATKDAIAMLEQSFQEESRAG